MKQLSLFKVQRRLAVIWLSGTAFPALVVLAQSILGRYGTRVEEAWAWLLPTVMPSLSLIIGVLVTEKGRQSRRGHTVDRFIAGLAVALSVAYLTTVNLTLLLSPFALEVGDIEPLTLYKRSHLWLAPFQGLVAATLGALFTQGPER